MAAKHVRLTFSGDEVKRPLIYELGQQFQVITNIPHGRRRPDHRLGHPRNRGR